MTRLARHALPLAALLFLTGCKTELYTALPEQEANEMIAILQQHGIDAAKRIDKDGSDTVSVTSSRFSDAVALLRQEGYPRKHFETMGDVFRSSGLVPSPTQERARFLYATDQELSATISQIDGVLSARVQIVLPQDDILDRDPTPSSASVFVRYDPTLPVDHLVPQVKMLVANSVQGLTYDRVAVVMVPAIRQALPPDSPMRNGGALDTLLLGALGGLVLAALLGAAAWTFRQPLLRQLASLRRRPVPPGTEGSANRHPVIGPAA